MATLGLAATHGNILINGLASWKVMWGMGETYDDAYYSLGDLADGRFTATALTVRNTYGREKPYGIKIDASAKLLGTDKAGMLLNLHNLGNAQLAHKITAINGKTFHGEWGTKWRFDSSAGYGGHRFVEIMCDHTVLLTGTLEDWNDVIAAAPADGTPDAGDTLYSFDAGSVNLAGISGITIDPAGSAETVGNFKDARLIAELLTTQDNLGRSRGYGIGITVEFSMLQTDEELTFFDNQFSGLDSIAITLADSTVFTLTSQSGVSWTYRLEGDSDGPAVVNVKGGGVVKLTDWAGLIS